jgi:hypothetical protein
MSFDETESTRRQMVAEINSNPKTQEELGQTQQTWDTDELCNDFEVIGFAAPFVVVRRYSDGQKGTLTFQHSPRVYFDFTPVN